MFRLLDNKRKKTTSLLVNQAIGGQSVMYRIFRESLECDDKNIRHIELTYFTLAVLSYVYLRLVKDEGRKKILDDAIRTVINGSLPHCAGTLSFRTAVREYEHRCKEYEVLLRKIFTKDGLKNHALITLLLHAYKCTTQDCAEKAMIRTTLVSSLLAQYVLDNIDFVKVKLQDGCQPQFKKQAT